VANSNKNTFVTLGVRMIKALKPMFSSIHRLYIKFTSMQIRTKLVIVIGLLFITLTTTFSYFLVQIGSRILNERLAETCNLSLKHLSQVISDDLHQYYIPENVSNTDNRTNLAGHIRVAVLELQDEEIKGLAYASVIDRDGQIIAHTDMDQINDKVSIVDSTLFISLNDSHVRETVGHIEYCHPIFAKKDSDNPVLLGISLIGFSKDEILQPINRATSAIIVATVLVTLLAVIAIFFISGKMTRQVDEMIAGVRRLSDGDMNHEIAVVARDELGHLATEFNNMMVHMREKLQMQKFVSKLTVQMIQKRSRHEDLLPVAETRKVTLLFSDIRSFSAMTKRLGPEEIVKLINIYLDLQARIIEENDGIVDKFVGDQVMAIFLGENQADKAIHTAVEIQRSIRKLNFSREQRGDVTLKVGCGLNFGPAVMGNMGSKSRLDYTVIGDVVNLAAALCAIAKPKQIIAPIEMAARLNGEYPTIRLNPVWVKGSTQPIEVFEVDYFHAMIM
jgi:class 3 adenylate cyclase